MPVFNLKRFSVPASFFECSFFMCLGFPVTEDVALNQACVAAFRELIKIGADHGRGEYRTPVIFHDQAMGVYSHNNHALLRFHEAVNDAMDPKGILSPGRYGIWPKHLRRNAK